MKKAFFVFIICLLSGSLFAQQSKEDAMKDTKAIEIVDKLVAKMKSYTTIKMDFTYKMENKQEKINQSKKGNILLKGNKYKMEVSGQQVFCNGTTQWLYLVDAEEVTITAVDTKSEDNMMNPVAMLDNYKNNYKAVFVKEVSEGGIQKQIVDLYPKKQKNYIKVRLYIDKAKNQLTQADISTKNGTNSSYIVDKLTPNVASVDTDFVFDTKKYPNVDVNDMR